MNLSRRRHNSNCCVHRIFRCQFAMPAKKNEPIQNVLLLKWNLFFIRHTFSLYCVRVTCADLFMLCTRWYAMIFFSAICLCHTFARSFSQHKQIECVLCCLLCIHYHVSIALIAILKAFIQIHLISSKLKFRM